MSQSSADIVASIENVDAQSFANNVERAKAMAAVTKLLARLESPWETCMKLIWIQPALNACLKVCVDCNLFEKWVASGSGPKSGEELAQMSKFDFIT